jgi:excisionase family DNA binding protein
MTAVSTQSTNRLAKEQDTNLAEKRHTLTIDQDLVNVFTIADHFNVHYRTAQRWTRNKWIPHYRVGKSIRYSLTEVMDAVSSHVR